MTAEANRAPERIVERKSVVYEIERKCLAPGCGQWFAVRREWQRWCSGICRLHAFRKSESLRGRKSSDAFPVEPETH